MYGFIFILLFCIIFMFQIALCLKCKRVFVKWIPFTLSSLVAVGFFVAGMLCDDAWAGAGLWIFGMFSLLMVAASGIGWLVVFLMKKHYTSRFE